MKPLARFCPECEELWSLEWVQCPACERNTLTSGLPPERSEREAEFAVYDRLRKRQEVNGT